MLSLVADRLRSKPVTEGVEQHLKDLEELELRSTGSWAIVAVGPDRMDHHRHPVPGELGRRAFRRASARSLLGG